VPDSPPELQKNAIGMWQIVFFVIAAAAPLTGMLGIIPVAIRLRALLLSSIFACLLAFHNTMVAPVLGMAGLGYALYLLITNLPALSGSDDGFVRSFPWIMLGLMLLGIGVSLGISRRGVRVPLPPVADEA